MGCGASAHGPSKEEPGAETLIEDVCWAKKIASPVADDAMIGGSKGTSVGKASGSSTCASERDQNITLLDAEDDDDEIEIIYEKPSKAPRQPAAANGQEPPEFFEPEVQVLRPEPKPLSKQQQDEAAKLAERRKCFDNERYQREQRGGSDVGPFDMPGVGPGGNGGYPGPAQPERIDSKPKPDMIFGLNRTASIQSEATNQDPPDITGGCIPGGIFDDDMVVAPPTKNREQQHHEVKSIGYDADDEMLMKEILENCAE